MTRERLIRERERRGLSQERLARLVGVSLRQYQRWEYGETDLAEHRWFWIQSKLAEYDKHVA